MSTTLTQGFANLIAPSFTSCQVALIQQNGVECSGGGYVRQTLGNVSTSSDTANAYISNASQIIYPQATADIASMTNPVAYVSLYSSSTLIATVSLPEPKPYLNGDQFIIPINGLTIAIPLNTT
jgi:hypothetical protein